jgi:hypothetical protein
MKRVKKIIPELEATVNEFLMTDFITRARPAVSG